MTETEAFAALAYLRQAYAYVPLSDVQARQFARLFRAYSAEIVQGVLDDLIRLGLVRPSPAEMGEMCRTKSGAQPAGQRARNDGPFLADEPWPYDGPLDTVPGWADGLAEAKRRLSAPSESEQAAAEVFAEAKRIETEDRARPSWARSA